MNLARFSCSPVSSGSSGLVNSVDWLEQKKDVDARHEVGLVIFCLGRGGRARIVFRQFRVVTVVSRSKVVRRFLSATAGPCLAIRRCSTTRAWSGRMCQRARDERDVFS